MITFSKIGEHGRLGNQLFQYALLKSVSIKTGYKIFLPNLTERVWHGQKCLLKNFKLPSCNFDEVFAKHQFCEKVPFCFDQSVFEVKEGTDFYGFFQHQKYYTDITKELRAEFELCDTLQNFVNSYLSQYTKPTVSLHVRRGDASDGTNPVDAIWINDFSEGSFLQEYYTKALLVVPENCDILLFTGGSREKNSGNMSDLEWCKKHFKDERITFVDDLNDIETFGVMKECDYNITSFSSTYSWWASFLNKNENIIASKTYYPTMTNIKAKDIYPDNWNLI